MKARQKTSHLTPTGVSRAWYVCDASKYPLGRLSTHVARVLSGKTKPQFSTHIDVGDFVIVINTDKLQVTGTKEATKMYYRHSGYPGGIKERTLGRQRELDSREIVLHAVKGMLPKNKLMEERLKRLKLYKNEQHSHEAQQPEDLEIS